jgi:2-polyprenyl-3-methyl-5-hydroxy-6-metoxy-1,4-benzoquinol methylase
LTVSVPSIGTQPVFSADIRPGTLAGAANKEVSSYGANLGEVSLAAPANDAEMTMHQPARFWDGIAGSYAKKPVADEEAYRKKLQVTRGYLRPDMEVLEFGCGTGSTAIAHAPYVKHIHAIDISSKMIEIARGKAAAGNVRNVTFEQSGIDEFSVPDQTFDAVLALSILHLVENKDEVIAKVHRMLKPGGIFVSSTACLGDTMKFFKVIAPVGKLIGLMPLLKVFTKKELEHSLSAAGFETVHQWQPGKGKAVFIVAKKAG